MPNDPQKKRAIELSVVPDFIREKFRESQRNKTPPVRTMPQERGDDIPEEERMRLREMIGEGESPKKFAKGGMAENKQYGRKSYTGGTMLVRKGVSADDLSRMAYEELEKDPEKAVKLFKAAGEQRANESLGRDSGGGVDSSEFPGAPEGYKDGPPKKFAKGGMVKGYAKGGSVMPRGYGKARSKPCKLS